MADDDLEQRRLHWLGNFSKISSLPHTPTQPFIPYARSLLAEYKRILDLHLEGYNALAKELTLLGDAVVTVSPKPLTSGQQQALLKLDSWIKGPKPYFVLKGYAGTGKTYTVSLFAKQFTRETAMFTAPTNKATKVLKSLLGDHFQCRTIYSALSLKMVEVEDELVLTESEEKLDLSGIKLICIDESSMLNRQLMEKLDEARARWGFKVLFICDLAQLPPVGEALSPVASLKCPKALLDEVVRHDNQILDVATHVRRCVTQKLKLTRPVLRTGVDKCVWNFSRGTFLDKLRESARSGYFNTKAIAWRNATVDGLNEVVRQEIYTHEELESSFWLPKDRIVIVEPVKEGNRIVATVDDEGRVETSDIGVDPQTGLTCYFLSLKLENGQTIRIRTIHESSLISFEDQLARLASEARKPKQGFRWKYFWELKGRYIKLKHGYALTAHRSQGSTFRDVFVDVGDIISNPMTEEAYRCLYVALTRPSRFLFMTGMPK